MPFWVTATVESRLLSLRLFFEVLPGSDGAASFTLHIQLEPQRSTRRPTAASIPDTTTPGSKVIPSNGSCRWLNGEEDTCDSACDNSGNCRASTSNTWRVLFTSPIMRMAGEPGSNDSAAIAWGNEGKAQWCYKEGSWTKEDMKKRRNEYLNRVEIKYVNAIAGVGWS